MVSKDGKRVALYLRVSTKGQTTENQQLELEEAAQRHGWHVIHTFKDEGISGAKGRDLRPGLDAMLKAVARKEVDLVAAWSVDRMGRSMTDLLSTLAELHAKNCGLYLHQQGLDTGTPAGKAMFGMMGVFAEFERAIIQERVKAGLARAKEKGTKSGMAVGRPKLGSEASKGKRKDASRKLDMIASLHSQGIGKQRIAKELKVGVGTVIRVLSGKAAPIASLAE